MRAFKYITKVSNKGVIQIPNNPALYDKEVEVIIVPVTAKSANGEKATDFVEKWAGFLKNPDSDALKHDYLSDKYR